MSAVARLAPQGAQRWMLDVQVQGEEEEEEEEGEEEVKRERGTERQAGQRRRWREGREDGDGGLEVQFCVFGIALVSFVNRGEAEKGGLGGEEATTYTTNNPPAPPTIAHQIPRAGRHFARDEMSRFAQYVPFPPRRLARSSGLIGVAAFVLAPESLLHEAGAVLQQIGADLTACAR